MSKIRLYEEHLFPIFPRRRDNSKRIHEYELEGGNFDITDVDEELCTNIPSPLDMGKVYTRLIIQTRLDEEDYAQGIIRVYNDEICKAIDNYNCSAYYEPSYFIARSYFAGGFV